MTAQNIKQGADFLKQIVPVIMASNACEYGGVIATPTILWDLFEPDTIPGSEDEE